jgi:hypothetical protein
VNCIPSTEFSNKTSAFITAVRDSSGSTTLYSSHDASGPSENVIPNHLRELLTEQLSILHDASVPPSKLNYLSKVEFSLTRQGSLKCEAQELHSLPFPPGCGSFKLEAYHSSNTPMQQAVEPVDSAYKRDEFSEQPSNPDELHHMGTIKYHHIEPCRTFMIGDSKAIDGFYRHRIDEIKQLGIKSILKRWIATLEPRKQSQYPYRTSSSSWRKKHEGADPRGKVPPWWPIDQNVRHKEPDHSEKRGMSRICALFYGLKLILAERVILFLHILRLRDKTLVDYGANKTQRTWIDVLEDSTQHVSFQYPGENDLAASKRRRKALRSLYDAARKEEGMHEGEYGRLNLTRLLYKLLS